MHDSLKFKGEVIARNKSTGEIIFKRHNCIVEGGRLMTLAKAMGLDTTGLNDLGQAITDNDVLKEWFEAAGSPSGNYKITHYKVGYDTSEAGVAMPLSVNTKATDITVKTNPWYVNEVEFFEKADVQKDDIPEDYTETYTWSDASTDMQPIINCTSEFDTLFMRYKLGLKMPNDINDSNNIAVDDDEKTPGWHCVDTTLPYVTVNELGLFMSDPSSEEDWILFSLLKFPPVTLQAEMEVEFEYRIYG